MRRFADIAAPVLFISALLGLWEWACIALHVPTYFLPAPSAIAKAIVANAPALLRSATNTLGIAILSLALASLVATTIAFLVALNRTLERAIQPIAVALQVTPIIAIAPQGTIHITDREIDRIQLFDEAGTWLADWRGDFDMPSDLAIGRNAIYVGGRDGLSIWTRDRQPIIRWAADEPYPGAFNIHGIWLDADENIFLAHFDQAVSKLTRLP